MENDAIEKTIKHSYGFVDNKAKAKQKHITKPTKKYKKDHKSNIEIFQKMKKLKIYIYYANNKKNYMTEVDRGNEKEYMKNYYYKRKKLVNYLINPAEELENAWISI